MQYDVLLFETVEKYLNFLQDKAEKSKQHKVELKQILQHIYYLKTSGTYIGEPVTKHIQGTIWELRPNNNRILYAHFKDNKFILLHIFRKTTKTTPTKEIEQAKANLKIFLDNV